MVRRSGCLWHANPDSGGHALRLGHHAQGYVWKRELRSDRLPGVVDPLPRERRALALAVCELRARRRMTQEELAHAAGVSRNYVGELEQGRRATTFEALILVARGLDVPLGELVATFEARLLDAE